MKYALVRVPDDAPEPQGLVGWYEVRAPRRYAVIADVTRWRTWVARRRPYEMCAACGQASHDFESRVRRAVAAFGGYREPGTEGPVEPVPGVEARTDSTGPRLHCTLPTGVVWDSALDVAEATG